jgi:DNA polymerase III delta subunit
MHILIVSGDEEFARKRCLEGLLEQARRKGAVVSTPKLESNTHLPTALTGDVTYVGQADPKLEIKSLTADPGVGLILEIPATLKESTRVGGWVKANPAYHQGFNRPPVWELESYCVTFIVAEFKRYKKACPEPLAIALYGKVGCDFGLLAREIEKLSLVMGDGSMLEARHFAGVLSGLGETTVSGVVSALTDKSKTRLSRALYELESKGTPLFLVTRSILKVAWQWLCAIRAHSKQDKSAANTLKLNPWFYENKVLPPALRWGEAGLVSLLKACSAAEQAQLAGAKNAWALLVTALLQAV